jgi:alkylation response protein AidB-like acyl-CoA dehydrogenase
MDFGTVALTPEQQDFADEVRSFLDALVTPDVLEHERAHGDGFNERVHLALGSRGWLTPEWAPEDGGAGLDPLRRRILELELQRHRVPDITAGTTNLVWTAVDRFAEESLRAELAPRVAAGTARFCLGYTDPEGGSDIAASRLRAVRDGDEWVLNGQKVWTTLAHLARFGMIVARTDPQQPKHKGMTYCVVDMHAPGVEVRPLRQITGEAEFNEVYFTDVRIPDAERLGDVGEGWRVSLTTLMNERVSIGGSVPPRGSGLIGLVVKAWQDAGIDDPAKREELMRLWTRAEALRLTNWRASQNRKQGTPGPEGSIGKLGMADLNKELTSFWVDLLGADGMLYSSYEMTRPATAMVFDGAQKAFLRCRANSIEGGTSEVMRNILGERVLGLPGDVRTDRELPWSEVPRS